METKSPELTMNVSSKAFGKLIAYGFMSLKIGFRRLRFASRILNQKRRDYIDIEWATINHNRIELVNRLAQQIQASSYLEIGTANNELFDSVICENKSGVDPHKGGNIRLTSDSFFEVNKTYFDLVFIDGLHTYEQVLKDVNNSLKFLNKGGVIALHDMFPRNWKECFMPPVTLGDWTGDVWKLGFSDFRSCDLEFVLVEADHGLGVIKLVGSDLREIKSREDLIDKDFSFFYDNYKSLSILSWKEAVDWIAKIN